MSQGFRPRLRRFLVFAKAGFGAGASGPKFDDAAWQKLDLLHDWSVGLPFSERGSRSHGYSKHVVLKGTNNPILPQRVVISLRSSSRPFAPSTKTLTT